MKSFKKRLDWRRYVSFDKATGFFSYQRYGRTIYIRHPRHFLPESENNWLCENIFFKYYTPSGNDVVVDLGAGYGEEAVWLSHRSPHVQYYGIETQPIIFECLSNTYRSIGKSFKAFPYAVTQAKDFMIQSQFSYASSSEQTEGYIYVPTLTWDKFCELTQLKNIDLLKMNIEGAEKYFLQSIKDFSGIKRMIISCHDFRANSGDGEHYRTKKEVIEVLEKNHYKIKTFNLGRGWSEDWLYAEQ